MKYTKGKWHWFGSTLRNEDNKIVFTELRLLNEETPKANRILIAAAPEMLEMLKRVVDGKKSIPRKEVRKLIAKAEGEEDKVPDLFLQL